MQKVWTVAAREFRSTVMTKAFVLGLMLPPVLMGVAIVISVLFSTDRAPAIRGTVAVIDRTSQAAPGIERRMMPDAISKATSAAAGEAIQTAAKAAEKQAANPAAAANPASQIQTMQETLGSVGGKAPELTLELLAPDADVEAEKKKLLSWRVDDLTTSPPGRLTLIVIEHDTIRPPEGSAGTPYALYTAPKVDPRVTSLIRGQVSDAVIEARLSGAGFDPARIEQLTNLPRPKTTEVTAEGTRASTGAFQFIIPLAFFLLIWISAFSGAGQLLNNTIEEKSNRIMEVLLSAVSPFQLMAG
ncbi:MAG: ABC transporter permease [Phycisphaerales bacterium]|nr:ABC transporter permease [Phycisphaerales bacterium]